MIYETAPDASLHCEHGDALHAGGDLVGATASYLKALALQPDSIEILRKLAVIMAARGAIEPAIRICRRIFSLQPDDINSRLHLGALLWQSGSLDAAAKAFEELLRLRPDHAEACAKLAVVLGDLGRGDDSVASWQRAVELDPRSAATHSHLLYAMHTSERFDLQAVFAEHLRWARRHAPPEQAGIARALHQPTDGRLRIGYISADFRDHPTARFIEPILSAHDRVYFEVFCYCDVARPDDVTERCRRAADVWRNVHGQSDDQVANLIRADRIDILVDSTGHMAGNRLKLFAIRPAPIQVALPMYPGTTGLSAIDYFFTDGLVDPPGVTEHLYVEKLVRLSPIARCYRPDDKSPDTIPLPAGMNGAITFGAFNRLSKVSDAMLSRWAEILAAVPGSRLRVLVEGPGGDQTSSSIRERFQQHGLGPERVQFIGRQKRWQYLETLAACDICLDTFPYNGCTTTCDSLWMGTPVVTLSGNTHASRVTFAFLSQVGLADLASESPAEYVRIAIDLAKDRARLRSLRSGLRERMRQSPLADGHGFTRQFEKALWSVWGEL